MSSIIQKENFQYEKQQFTILGNVPALPYICNVCEMAFAKKYFIRSHLMTVHEVSLINFLVLILLLCCHSQSNSSAKDANLSDIQSIPTMRIKCLQKFVLVSCFFSFHILLNFRANKYSG